MDSRELSEQGGAIIEEGDVTDGAINLGAGGTSQGFTYLQHVQLRAQLCVLQYFLRRFTVPDEAFIALIFRMSDAEQITFNTIFQIALEGVQSQGSSSSNIETPLTCSQSQSALDSLKDEMKSLSLKLEHAEETVRELEEALKEVTVKKQEQEAGFEDEKLRSIRFMEEKDQTIEKQAEELKSLSCALQSLAQEREEFKEKYFKEQKMTKKLFNELLDARGNIGVLKRRRSLGPNQ